MYDLLIVGAGPYGLSIAAHAAARGLDARVLGRPMESWRHHMPRGMFLKSEPWASDLSAPGGRYRLGDYCAGRGVEARHGSPVPVDTFTSYGLWFARNAVPRLDERLVESVDATDDGFTLRTEDGELLRARAVALANGVLPYVHVPSVLRELSRDHVTHSSWHSDLGRFRGKDVTVIGGGQAALETAALLAEQHTRVRVLARAPELAWNTVPPPWVRPWWQRLRAPHSGLGCGWHNWFYAQRPGAFRRLPEATRARVTETALGPAGAWWIRERVNRDDLRIGLGRTVVAARQEQGGRLALRAQGPHGVEEFDTDHVIAATGFRADVDRMTVLAPALRARLARHPDGAPRVGHGFASAHPGLFLAGLVTAADFGPAMRFVHGASYTAPALVDGVERWLRRRPVVRAGGPAVPAGRRHEPVGGRASTDTVSAASDG
ncbi:NAD(P)-binding domain-containing protein [Streptomyces beihaiensis]|uniref:Lysine N(6)-hydroxylase/L-ornithine N(5)-oxygenase family protein n=1 Tax=Streptomyces beihaiensis TaxID=2984495 RepID=A0ABT3U072_9ACTN|nr:NAD(P)-binding domain-containing protein [Streptomyces beihaiensis]MCX3062711.1 lysine N(6)-hydroxylase/L-ornithine N(5)-oxygenase family protein [Streptomyces beihaiensis]